MSAERNSFSLVGHILAQIIYPRLFPSACHSPERFQLFLFPWSWVPFSHFMLILFFLKHHPSYSCMLKSYSFLKLGPFLAPAFLSHPTFDPSVNPVGSASKTIVSICPLFPVLLVSGWDCSHHLQLVSASRLGQKSLQRDSV